MRTGEGRVDAGSPVAEAELSFDGAREMETQMTYDAVRRAVSRLPEEQRAVVMLVCVEGQSYKEAADTLAVPIGTVMSRLSRARGVLARQLSDAPQGSSATVVRLKPESH